MLLLKGITFKKSEKRVFYKIVWTSVVYLSPLHCTHRGFIFLVSHWVCTFPSQFPIPGSRFPLDREKYFEQREKFLAERGKFFDTYNENMC